MNFRNLELKLAKSLNSIKFMWSEIALHNVIKLTSIVSNEPSHSGENVSEKPNHSDGQLRLKVLELMQVYWRMK